MAFLNDRNFQMKKTDTLQKHENQSERSQTYELNELVTQYRLIRIRTVINITGISKSYIYQLVKAGEFPKPVQLIKGGKAVAWIESEIQEWVESRIADRDMGVA